MFSYLFESRVLFLFCNRYVFFNISQFLPVENQGPLTVRSCARASFFVAFSTAEATQNTRPQILAKANMPAVSRYAALGTAYML